MDRQDVAYFVNSTPKYFYLLPLHFTLVRRYAAACKWPLYMVTEVPDHPTIRDLSNQLGVKILPIQEKEQSFIQSRVAACKGLPPSIKYILPNQEDFLLGGRIDEKAIEEALKIMDTDPEVVSVRLMPCPGPRAVAQQYRSSRYVMLEEEFMFTYQTTLWRREAYQLFLSAILDMPPETYKTNIQFYFQGMIRDENHRRKIVEVDFNLAENSLGQRKFQEVLGQKIHLAWPRAHVSPNAVMLSPWPYRPTAVERGKVGEWVYEFAKREGFPIQAATTL